MPKNAITSVDFTGSADAHKHPLEPISAVARPTTYATTRIATREDRWAVFRDGKHSGFVTAGNQADARKLVREIRGAQLILVTTYFRHAVKGGASWWRLYRRRPNRAGGWASLNPQLDRWSLDFEHRGARHRLSFGTDSVQLAIEQAKQQLTNHFDGHHEQFRGGMQRPTIRHYSTLAEVFAVRHQLAIDARTAQSVDNYMWGVRYVFKLIHGLKQLADADTLSTAELDKGHGRLYFVRAREEARRLPSQEEQNRFSRVCNQAYSFCCALFSDRAVESMTEDLKLSLPDTIPAFRARAKLDRLDGGDASAFHRPSDETIAATIAAWEKPAEYVVDSSHNGLRRTLTDVARRNMFIAIGLSLAFGLRRAERIRVCWSWFQTIEGIPMLRNQSVGVKGGTNEINVPALDPFWTTFNRIIDANHWRGAPDDFCLIERPKAAGQSPRSPGLQFSTGGRSDRTYWPAWDVSVWLRGLGWETQKTNHALRDLAASLITMKYGLDAAARWCRHKNRATTESHYSHFVELGKMVDPKKLAWFSWAK